MRTKIDLERLRIEIRDLSRRSPLYKVLKEELTKKDHWKQQRRGNPIKAFYSRRDKRETNA